MLLSLLSKRTLYDDSRDAYGFTVRPQHIHRYREYANIYKEEEGERLQKWKIFLEQQAESTIAQQNKEDNIKPVVSKDSERSSDPAETVSGERDDSTFEQVSGVGHISRENRYFCDTEGSVSTKEAPPSQQAKSREVKTWAEISLSLNFIEHMMSIRVKKRKNMESDKIRYMQNGLPSIDEARSLVEESEDDDRDVSLDNEGVDSANASAVESSASDETTPEINYPWKEELESLVQGGVPKDLRGEVWQAFVGVRTRRMESYYQELLATECDDDGSKDHDQVKKEDIPDKWKKQIDKDLPRTFPGHPALNENGRGSLRRVLLAYSRHNPSVGYCQAMNFFAGILLLMMPEENAFWTLVGIIDDYFEGYFSQEMIESQVDQLVFEDLMRERFPKLVNHLDVLGVEVAWISSPWFLSIFVNTLPWESVLRVWDVILFEGNRVMLFRTALALMDLYGPALVTAKDAGDVITLLQTLTGSTFDSSQLIVTASMGFLTITEDRLQELRQKHRPAIVAAIEERDKGDRVFKDPKGLATKLYSFKHDRGLVVKEKKTGGSDEKSNTDYHSGKVNEFLEGIESEVDSLPDLQEQVVWLKGELCRLLEEKKSSVLRAEELEAALMEMVEEDNRCELSATVEQLEKEVAELRQTMTDKKAQEDAMLQVLLKVEQEQRLTEDARLFAEQQAAAQKQAVHLLQEKYDQAMASLAEMEKRAVMAESLLEATLQYESGQSKALSSPKPGRPESPRDIPLKRTSLLSFNLGWRDRNKGKQSNDAAPAENKPKDEGSVAGNIDADINGHRE